MANSLADQLLKAGLVDKQKANKAKKEQHKKQKQKYKAKQPVLDESQLLAQQTIAAEKEKSRQLNLKREAESQAKAIVAQIKQLIEKNTIARSGDIGFKFVDKGKIKKIYINAGIQKDLNKGFLAIVKSGNSYELVPAVIAEKIAQRDNSYVLLINNEAEAVDEDDPYADYQIPDDLMW